MIVMIAGMIALIVDMLGGRKNNTLSVALSLIGLAAAGAVLVFQLGATEYTTKDGMMARDALSSGLQLAVVVATAITLMFSEGYMRAKHIAHGEFYPLILWSATGAMIMVSSIHLLVMFIGLEILSVSLYVLAGLSRSEEKSEESALKYFLLGAFASGFLLYGIAFSYGATGSLELVEIAKATAQHDATTNTLLIFGLGMMLIGLGFKLSLVPFHLWTPDVYQGAPTNVSSFMASVSKIAAFGALLRVLDSFSLLQAMWSPVLTAIAVLTMTYGNLVALRQTDVKRMLGYSSIANAGYVLVAVMATVMVPGLAPSSTVVYYLLGYSVSTIGAFAVLSLATHQGSERTTYKDLNGLYQRSPLAAIALALIAASLIGIPGTAGFAGKFFIIMDGVHANLTFLVIVLAINSIISVKYYVGLIQAAFTPADSDAQRPFAPFAGGAGLACAICALGTIGVGILAGPVLSAIGNSPK
jgi:NADH-quinone oxidoreductase subunit N